MKTIKKVRINLSTYIFIFLFLFSGLKKNVFYILIVFMVHELGHIFFCNLFKIKIISVDIYPFGGVIKLDKRINSPVYVDLFISLGGILFQVLLYFLNIFYFKNSVLHFYNASFLFLNLIPIIPLDGNKVFLSLLSVYIPYFYSLILNIISSLIILFIYIFFSMLNHTLNITFIFFTIFFTLLEIKHFKHNINRFYLERYDGNINFKKVKYYKHKNIKFLKRGTYGYFFDNLYVDEQKILAKKFDNSSYF